MLEAYGIGDLHLTDSSGKGGLAQYIDNPNRYVMSEVERVLDMARSNHVQYIFLYGDVCENPRLSYEGQLELVATFKRYHDLVFVVIPGNHDKMGEDSNMGHSLELLADRGDLPNVRVILNDKVAKINGHKVKFCPWPSTDFDKTALNVGHIEVKGSKSDAGRVMDGEELSPTKAVVVMGHLHTAHKVRNVYYSGTLYQTNFGESLPKYFHHIKWNGVEDYEIDLVPFEPKYKLHNCIIESQKDVDALPRGQFNLLKVVVKEGADVVMPDLPNIVQLKAFKTKAELEVILNEDLLQGSELVLKTEDFFQTWIDQQEISTELRAHAVDLRKKILTQRQTA